MNDMRSFLVGIRDSINKQIESMDESVPEPTPAKPVRILLDPGHSKKDPGAISVNGQLREYAANIAQADLIKSKLEARFSHVEVEIYDPAVDNLPLIGSRAKDFDAFLSLHHNSYGGRKDPGTEVWIHNKNKEASYSLAIDLCSSISLSIGSKNRGVKMANFAVLRAAEPVCQGPCVLVESFFVNPYGDHDGIARAKKAALGICNVLESWIEEDRL